MASLHSKASLLVFWLLILDSPTSDAQPGLPLANSPPPPLRQPPSSMSDCSTRLIPLTPCAPFVQGLVRSPSVDCCSNLLTLNFQQPECLCLLLKDTNFSAFTINTSLALDLPALCNVPVNNSTCSGTPPPTGTVAIPPSSRFFRAKKPNSSIAASPMDYVAPRPMAMGLTGTRESTGSISSAPYYSLFLINVAAFLTLLTKVY